MKRFWTVCLVLALAGACTSEKSLVEWAFDSHYSTKAAISRDGAFSWQQGDQIDVWNATDGAFVSFETLAGQGRFRAMAPADAHFRGMAFYPQGIASNLSTVTLPALYASPAAASASFPMYALVNEEDRVLHFRHLGALLTITVTRAQPELNRLELRSSAVSLSGTYSLSGTPEIQGKAGSDVVAVQFSLTEEGTLSITVPVPTGEYPLSVCLGTNENPEMLVLSSSGPLRFERVNHYRFSAFDYLTKRFSIPGNCVTEDLTLEDHSSYWEVDPL